MKDFKKNAVKLEMKFRHFTDPAFLDPKANDKIFVPVQNVSLTLQNISNLMKRRRS